MKETRSRIVILAGAILAYAFLLFPLLVVIGASLRQRRAGLFPLSAAGVVTALVR